MVVTVATTESELFTMDAGVEAFCGYFDGILPRYTTSINCQRPITGQFVQVLMNANTMLNLYEVEVFGMY